MKNRLFAVLAVVTACASPLLAHHGMSWADNEHPITVTGTVAEFRFVNPHCRMVLNVKNADGAIDRWDIEMPGPSTLHSAGWNSETIKPGDTVAASGGPAKDGRHLMASRRYVINGKEKQTHGDE